MLNRPSPEIVAETESEVEVMDEISSGQERDSQYGRRESTWGGRYNR